MSKRVAYPIFLISFFLIINIALRLVDYMLTNEGVDVNILIHIFNASDFLIVMATPLVLFFEQRNETIKKFFYLYLAYGLFTLISNILFIQGILSSDGVLWYLPEYGIVGLIIYIGYVEDRDNNKIYRMGRSIMATGFVHLTYLFIMPNTLERLFFTYDYLYLNPMPFIIIIMQLLLLDDVLLHRQQVLDDNRVRLDNLENQDA